jgi:hypothetical protein
MAYISSYLNDQLVAKQVDAIVDETLLQLRQRSAVLMDAAPIKEYSSRNFLGLLTEEVNPIASIVSYGQKIPNTQFGSFKKITAEMAKIAVSRQYDEKLQWEMYEAMDNADAKGITIEHQVYPDGSVMEGQNNDLSMLLFGSLRKLARSVHDRLDSLTWQALQTGAIDIEDQRSNAKLQLDFKDSAGTYNHFPDALVATGNATKKLNKWSNYEYADGLQNLYDLTDTYIDTNGYPPDYFVLSRKLLNHLLQQKTTKDAATQVKGSAVGVVSRDLLNAVLDARMIPRLVVVDDRYNIEDSTKNITNARFLNENRIVGIKKGMGQRAIGSTIESSNSIDPIGVRPKPISGLYLTTYEESKFPPLDVSVAVMTALPIFLNPKYFLSQVVN